MTLDLPGGRDHPTWLTAAGTVVGYGVVLAIIFAVLFVLPYVLWVALG